MPRPTLTPTDPQPVGLIEKITRRSKLAPCWFATSLPCANSGSILGRPQKIQLQSYRYCTNTTYLYYHSRTFVLHTYFEKIAGRIAHTQNRTNVDVHIVPTHGATYVVQYYSTVCICTCTYLNQQYVRIVCGSAPPPFTNSSKLEHVEQHVELSRTQHNNKTTAIVVSYLVS